MALNLGHTFAHAIEPLPGLSPDGESAPLQHGEAVALGLVAASRCSVELGLWSSGQAQQATALIRDCGLPVAVRGLPAPEEVIHRMGFDKKSRGGKLRLILPCGDGRVRVVEDPDPAAVRAGLAAIRA